MEPSPDLKAVVQGVHYTLLPQVRIREYCVRVCEEEWDPPDFEEFGPDLYRSVWSLEEVRTGQILPNAGLMARESFQDDLRPRIATQMELFGTQTPIPPLILRGRDHLIFDGYARYHMLKRVGASLGLAYVGRHE